MVNKNQWECSEKVKVNDEEMEEVGKLKYNGVMLKRIMREEMVHR